LSHKIRQIRSVLRAIESGANEGELWLGFGNVLKEQGQVAAALRAMEIALECDPKLVAARRALRRIDDRDLSMAPEVEAAFRSALRKNAHLSSFAESPISTEQVQSGNGANTNYVAKHCLTGESAQRNLLVIEKSFVLTEGEPREVKVYRDINRLPSGPYFRFPEVYAILLQETCCSVFMELVEVVETKADFLNRLLIRAKALGDFNGRGKDTVDLQAFSLPLRDHRIDTHCVDAFEKIVEPARLMKLRTTFLELVEVRTRLLGKLPETLVRGDTQPANLLMDREHRIVFIDNGRIHRGPVGEDMGSLLWSTLLRGGDSADRIERQTLATYFKFLSLHGKWSVDEVRKGYGCQLVRLIYHRILRPLRKPRTSSEILMSSVNSMERLVHYAGRAISSD
jgi:tetratricopeptide (TPR) repeat protein